MKYLKHILRARRVFSLAEKRLLAFADWEQFKQRREKLQTKRDQEAVERGEDPAAERAPGYVRAANEVRINARTIAQNEANSPFGGRGYAPEVDVAYAENIATISMQDLADALNDEELEPLQATIIREALKLMRRFPEEEGVKGIAFGFNGTEIRVTSGDPTRIADALAFAQGKLKLYSPTAKVEAPLTSDPLNESPTELERRTRTKRETAGQGLRHNEDYASQQREVWNAIIKALESYQSDYRMHDAIRKDLESAPGKLREYEHGSAEKRQQLEGFKKFMPKAYTLIVRDAARRDPSILTGKEGEFVGSEDKPDAQGMGTFLQLLEEVWSVEGGEMAIRYYPQRIKDTAEWVKIGDKVGGLPAYREQMLLFAEKQPVAVLNHVLSEYDAYWKKDVPANAGLGKPEQKGIEIFSNVVATAITKEPKLFWGSWNKDTKDPVTNLRIIYEKLDVETRIAILESTDSVEKLQRLSLCEDGGLRAVVEAIIENDSADSPIMGPLLQTILRNGDLARFIRNADAALFAKIKNEAEGSADADVKALLTLTETHDVIHGEKDTPGDMFTRIVRNYGEETKSLITWNTENFAMALSVMRPRLDNASLQYLLQMDVITKSMMEDKANAVQIKRVLSDAEYDRILKTKRTLVPPISTEGLEEEEAVQLQVFRTNLEIALRRCIRWRESSEKADKAEALRGAWQNLQELNSSLRSVPEPANLLRQKYVELLSNDIIAGIEQAPFVFNAETVEFEQKSGS